MKRKVSLIFNPVAGQGNPEEDLATIESLLSPEIDLDVVITTADCEPGELTKAAIDRGAEAIIASGGDGTLSAVAAALMSSNPHSALQLLRHILVTKTRQFDDTTDRNSLIAVTQN